MVSGPNQTNKRTNLYVLPLYHCLEILFMESCIFD